MSKQLDTLSVYVYAPTYQLKEAERTDPISYFTLSSDDCADDYCVFVGKIDVVVPRPEFQEILPAHIACLREAQRKLRVKAEEAHQNIEETIQNLLSITYEDQS